MQHNKLVRDHIPAIITAQGQGVITRKLDEATYRTELQRKLQEETSEYSASGKIAELADILEVVYALAAVQDVTPAALEAIRIEKHAARGGFAQRIFLIETIDAID